MKRENNQMEPNGDWRKSVDPYRRAPGEYYRSEQQQQPIIDHHHQVMF